MTKADRYFKELCTKILTEGSTNQGEKVRPKYKDGTPAYTKFINQWYEEYDLSKKESPILTLRPLAWQSAIKEVLWIYQDQTSDLGVLRNKYNVHWWDDWQVGSTDSIGQRYGATVKKYDLMNKLLDGLKNEPYSRRHIMNLYQYSDFEETGGLYPCAMETHWSVRDGFLDMTLIQRSSDVGTANALNKIQYVALMSMVARHVGLKVGKFVHFVQNAHIYDRHLEAIQEMLKREGQQRDPRLGLTYQIYDFYDIRLEHFAMIEYNPVNPNFKFELAI